MYFFESENIEKIYDSIMVLYPIYSKKPYYLDIKLK